MTASQASLRIADLQLIAADVHRLALGDVSLDADLRAYSRWRCGGRGALVVAPRNVPSVARLLAYFHANAIPWAVVGHGSNLFFDDAGVCVPLVHVSNQLGAVRIDGETVHAEAGAWAPGVALSAMRAGLEGLEHIVGIPGTFGGLVLMNGGSLRRSVGDQIVEVEIAEQDGELRRLRAEDCGFAYRRSTLQGRACIVLGATLRLARGDRADMRRRMLDIMASRRRRFPRHLPNCGSVFVSDPALYASIGPPGAAIELGGLKGMRCGEAMVSTKHANFIVNLGDATAADILSLIKRVRDMVAARTGHRMRCEVRFMRGDGEVREAHDWLDDPAWCDSRSTPLREGALDA
jgi:UDP-N-acetylmuramate dehydrogenase